MARTVLEELKLNLREMDYPYFSDEQLQMYLDRNGGDLRVTSYECLIIKSQDTSLSVSGLSCGDTSKYFLRLASMYAPNNSGTLKGAW